MSRPQPNRHSHLEHPGRTKHRTLARMGTAHKQSYHPHHPQLGAPPAGNIIKPIHLLVFVALIISPASLHALELGPGGLLAVGVPAGSVPLSPVKQADFDGDGHPETLLLSGGQASVLSQGGIVWQSPTPWQVVQAEITDLNHDGHPEATLLVWRPFQPWPVDRWLPVGGRIGSFHDSVGDSCHLILVGRVRGRMRRSGLVPQWPSRSGFSPPQT